MPNNCLSVLYKRIIQVENKNVGLKVGGHKHTIAPPPPPPRLPTPVIYIYIYMLCRQLVAFKLAAYTYFESTFAR